MVAEELNDVDFRKIKKGILQYWQNTGRIHDYKVMAAFLNIPREKFVLKGYQRRAYDDCPLPIVGGQTISQPLIVVQMTEFLELEKGQTVLEIGAGSGYQAALIADIVGLEGKVVSTERIKEVADFAKENLENTGVKNVEVVVTDGSCGYEREAPYDRIIVTAACPKIPPPLIEQLKPRGIIIAPVGDIHLQELIKLIKHKNGEPEKRVMYKCMFVPLIGKYGFKGQ